MNYGDNLKKIRIEAGITQAEFAEKLGVTQSLMCQIERGTKALTLPMAVEVCAILHCSLEDIAGIAVTD